MLVESILKLIIAVPLGIWLYRDAKARDYSWMLWACSPFILFLAPLPVAFILAVILLVVYLIMRPAGALFNCPHCNKKVHEVLFVCPFCQKNAKHECLNCHEPVSWEAEQCPYCQSRNLTKE